MATFTVKEERKTEEIRQQIRVPEMEEVDERVVVVNGYVDGDGEVLGGGGGAGSPDVAQGQDPDLEPETGESEAVGPVQATGSSGAGPEELTLKPEEEVVPDDGKTGSRSKGLIDYFKLKTRSLSRDRTGNRVLAKAVARSGSVEAVAKDTDKDGQGAPGDGNDGKRRSGGRRKKWRIFGGKKSAKDHDQTSSDEGEGTEKAEGKEDGERKGVHQSEGKEGKRKKLERVEARPGVGGEPEGVIGKSSPSGDEDGSEAAEDTKKAVAGKGVEKEAPDGKSRDHNRWFHFGRRGGDKDGDHVMTKESPDETGAKESPQKWNIFGKKTRKSEQKVEIQAVKEEVTNVGSSADGETEVELLSWKPLENADPEKEQPHLDVGVKESQASEPDKGPTDGIHKKEPKKFSFGLKLGKKSKKPEDREAEKEVKGDSKVESVAVIHTASSTSEEKPGTCPASESVVDGTGTPSSGEVQELPGTAGEASNLDPDLVPEGPGTDVVVDGTSKDDLEGAGRGDAEPNVENQVCIEKFDPENGEFKEVLTEEPLPEMNPEKMTSIPEEPDTGAGTSDELQTISHTDDEVPVAEQSTSVETEPSPSDDNPVPDIRDDDLPKEVQTLEIVAEEEVFDVTKEPATSKDPGTSQESGQEIKVMVELSPEPGGAIDAVCSKSEEEILAKEEKTDGEVETAVKAEDRKEVRSKTFKMWSPFTKKTAKKEKPSTGVEVEGGKEIQATTPDSHGDEAPTISGVEEVKTPGEGDKAEVTDPKHHQPDSREGTLKRNKLQKLFSFGKKPKEISTSPEVAMTSPEVVERKETEEEVPNEAGVSAEKGAAVRRHDDEKTRHKKFSFGLKTFYRKHEKEPEATEKETPEAECPATNAQEVSLSGPMEAEQRQPEAEQRQPETEKISEANGSNLSETPPPPSIQDVPVSEPSPGSEDTKDAAPGDPESLTSTRPDKDDVKAHDDVTEPSDVIKEGELPGKDPDVTFKEPIQEHSDETPPGAETSTPAPIEAVDDVTGPSDVITKDESDVGHATETVEVAPPGIEGTAVTPPVQVESSNAEVSEELAVTQDKDKHLDAESRLPVDEVHELLVLEKEASGDVEVKAGKDSPVEEPAKAEGPGSTPETKQKKPLFQLKFGKKRKEVDGKPPDQSPRDEVAEAVVEPPGKTGTEPPGKTGSDDVKSSTAVEQLIIEVEVVETKEDSKAKEEEEEDTKDRPSSGGHVIKWPHFGGKKSDKKKEEDEDKDTETPENEKDSTGKLEKTSGKKYSHGLGKGFLKMFSPKKHPKSGRNGGSASEQHQESFVVYSVERDGQLVAETHWKHGKYPEKPTKSFLKSSSPPPPSGTTIKDSPLTNGDVIPSTPSGSSQKPEPEVVESESRPDAVPSPRPPSGGADPEHFVVVAVDLGTTFSGYAFGFVSAPDSVHLMRKWEGGDPGVVDHKTPSALLLDPDGRFHSFGFTARDFYHDLDATEAGKWAYFEKWKMVLHDNAELNEETKIVASNGTEHRAMTIFAHCLRFFHDNALKELSSQSSVAIDNDDVRWVVTVPAIWSASARQFMRSAAYQAGIASPRNPERLLIALESEAASIHILRQGQSQKTEDPCGTQPSPHSPRRESRDPTSPPHHSDWHPVGASDAVDTTRTPASTDHLKAGTRYMVVDCGSGKVDIAVHEVETEKGRVREIHKASGGPFGCTAVDRHFERLLDEIFGAGLIEAFRRKRPGGWVDLMIAFESRKRAASPHRDNSLNISLPFSFIDFYKKQHGTQVDAAIEKFGGHGVTWSLQGMLRLTPEAMRSLFRPTIDGIKDAVSHVLKDPSVKGVGYLFLVGGFAESADLQNEIRKAFDDQAKVIVPQEASLAVLKGAVSYGLDPTIVTARQSRMTYGVGAVSRFDPTRHPESMKVRRDGSEWCPGVFDPFVRSGETLTLADKVVRLFAPVDEDQMVCNIGIYGSESGEVRFVGDDGVRLYGTLRIDRHLANDGGTEHNGAATQGIGLHLANDDGNKYKGSHLANDDGNKPNGVKAVDSDGCQFGRVIETTMTFGGTEIDVIARDVVTGLTARTVMDFLNK